jgi:hypothetical protein
MQHILLQSYLGGDDYFYLVDCSGDHITRQVAMDLGFVTEEDFDKHNKSNYGPLWFAIEPGDIIEIEITKGVVDENYVFTIPSAGLPDPPVRLDDPRTQNKLHEYLKQHCSYTQPTT